MTLAETISETSKNHLLHGNGLLFGQCLGAVGRVSNSVPELTEDQGIVELPTSDVSNSGIVVGAALAGRRPIYVIRYQGFMWYNAANLLNYAAKSKFLWNVPCPVFVRSLGMEGSIGPVASGQFHSLVMHMPGMPVAAPITPQEWLGVWQWYLGHDDPVYCSESRQSLTNANEIPDLINNEVDVTIFAISISRVKALEAASRVGGINVVGVVWLKPFEPSEEALESLKRSKFGLVIDGGHTICGASQSLAYELMVRTGKKVYAMGLRDETAGFAAHCDNVTPGTDEIIEFIRNLVV